MEKMGRKMAYLITIVSAFCIVYMAIGMNFSGETKSELYDSPLFQVRSDAVSSRVEKTNVVNSFHMSESMQSKFQYGYDLVSKMDIDEITLLQKETVATLREIEQGDLADIIGNIPTSQLAPDTLIGCKIKITNKYAWWDLDHDGELDQDEIAYIGSVIIALTAILGISASQAAILFESIWMSISPAMAVFLTTGLLIGAGLIFIGLANIPTMFSS
jgi:hypothetical protein